MQVYNDELYHYGKIGMKWGKRSSYGRMPIMITKKRQLAADKKMLDGINGGAHVRVGLTKKRQEVYDKKDKATLEKRIAKNTEMKTETPKSKFSNKHEVAKWTSATLAVLGTKAVVSSVLLNKFGVDGTPRLVAGILAGSMAGNKVFDAFENKR